MRDLACSILAAAWLLASCGSEPAATPAAFAVQVESDGSAVLTVEGAVLEIDPGVRFELTVRSSTHANVATLEGYPFGVSEGRFHIGPVDYGPVAPAARVSVAPDGVSVEGEHRGELPPPLER